MRDYVRMAALAIFSFVAGGGAVLIFNEAPALVRSGTGLVVGGFYIESNFDRISLRRLSEGVDNVLYSIETSECDGEILIDVSLSGDSSRGAAIWNNEIPIELREFDHHSGARRAINAPRFVHISNQGNHSECHLSLINRIIIDAIPVYELD